MAAGLGLLRLEPRAFWGMTLKELQAAMNGYQGLERAAPPLRRQDLSRLMQNFPDKE